MKTPSPEWTQEARAAYQRLLERGSPEGLACPDPGELLALAEARFDEGDRLRVLDHLGQCPQCQRDFDLLRTLAHAKPARTFQVRPWMAAAASVVLFIGAGFGVWRGAREGGGAVMRGPESSVELVSPAAGEVGPGEVEFRWRVSEDAFEYVFEIMDQSGRSLLAHVTTDTSLTLDLDEHQEMEGELLWWVRASLPDGTERTSETRRLELTGR